MKSVLQLLHLKRLRASLPLRQPRQEERQQVDPDEQLELLFRDVQRDSEPGAAQWQERATVFEDRIRRREADSSGNSSRRFSLSRFAWSAENGPRLAVFGVGVAALVGIVATSPSDVGPKWRPDDNKASHSRGSDFRSSRTDTSAAVSGAKAIPLPKDRGSEAIWAPDTPLVNRDAPTARGDDSVPSTATEPVSPVSLTPTAQKRVLAPAPRDVSEARRHADSAVTRRQQQVRAGHAPYAPTEPSSAKAKVGPVEDTFAADLKALKASDRALRQGRVDEARSMLSRNFSDTLAPHATALRAILACQTGNVRHGRRLIAAQSKRHPSSPYLPRMRTACGN